MRHPLLTGGRPRRMPAAAAVLLVLGLGAARPLAAQERLVRFSTASAGVVHETVRFGRGLAQGDAESGGVVRSASQLLVPLALSMPLGSRWTVDAATYLASSEVRFDDGEDGALSARLSGLGDLRVRAAGRFRDDAVLVTLGATVPTGSQQLDGEELAALGILAAPALGINLPAVSIGPNQTAGVVLSRVVGDRPWAFGMSYERRARFAPVASLAAGLAPTRVDPGDALHLSLGTDELVGRHALSVALLADLYGTDRVPSAADLAASTVRLGPVVGADVQLRLASTRVRDLTLSLSDRVRGGFTRDGAPVGGSGANYLTAGVSGAVPLRRGSAFVGGVQLWRHGGLDVDDALVTARASGAALTIGLDQQRGRMRWQPFVRLRRSGVDTGVERGTASGVSLGLTIARRA